MSEEWNEAQTSQAAESLPLVNRDMRELTCEELAGVAGGPEINNEPPPT